MTDILYLRERDVAALLDIPRAIDALEAMLAMKQRGAALNMPKTLATWGEGSSMHALGSLMPDDGHLGFKTWAHTRQGGAAIFSLFDAHAGRLLALVEARALGQLRTAGISGVATRAMSHPAAHTMALIGTGAQALLQVASVAAVRDLRQLRVYGPTPARRQAFVATVREAFGFEVVECSSVEDAVGPAQVVTTITRAREPFLTAAMLAEGTHVNAVGAILPTHAEFTQDLFDRAEVIAVDDLENARRGSRELRERWGSATAGAGAGHGAGQAVPALTGTPQAEGWHHAKLLEDLVAAPVHGARAGITLFKGMGMGLSDLALATRVHALALEEGRGIRLPAMEAVDPAAALMQGAAAAA